MLQFIFKSAELTLHLIHRDDKHDDIQSTKTRLKIKEFRCLNLSCFSQRDMTESKYKFAVKIDPGCNKKVEKKVKRLGSYLAAY